MRRSKNPIDLEKDPVGKKSFIGTWYTEKGAKGLLLTISELKFIEAEVQYKKGAKQMALDAYKAGIKAHIEIMGLSASDYLNSTSIIQNPSDLTLSHIILQKYIAMSYSPETFSDMRRMNYCTDNSNVYNEAVGVYKGFTQPGNVYKSEFSQKDMWSRRFAVASYSINFNLEQVLKANPNATSPGYLLDPIFWVK